MAAALREGRRARGCAGGWPTSASPPPPPTCPRHRVCWEVVGGMERGGIVVRQGRDPASSQLEARLSPGAVVEELDLQGDRLHFRRVSGTGPLSGWISLRQRGRANVRVVAHAPEHARPAQGQRAQHRGVRVHASEAALLQGAASAEGAGDDATASCASSAGSQTAGAGDPSPCGGGRGQRTRRVGEAYRSGWKANAMDLLRAHTSHNPRLRRLAAEEGAAPSLDTPWTSPASGACSGAGGQELASPSPSPQQGPLPGSTPGPTPGATPGRLGRRSALDLLKHSARPRPQGVFSGQEPSPSGAEAAWPRPLGHLAQAASDAASDLSSRRGPERATPAAAAEGAVAGAADRAAGVPVAAALRGARPPAGAPIEAPDVEGRALVYVRLCPCRAKAGERAIDPRGGGAIRLHGDNEMREFHFDDVFGEQTTQVEVFDRIGPPVLQAFLSGINGTILAYGQTGSGKTHSLLNTGPRVEDAGLLPRVVVGLFAEIAMDTENRYEVQAAAVQVYNEEVDDLLHLGHHSGGGQNLNVLNGGAVAGLTWVICRSPEEMLNIFARAHANVVYAETLMNKSSSRSHAIFHVRLTKRPADEGAGAGLVVTRARLNVVDLAGSERVKKSGVEGLNFREATMINNSLLTLGNVMSALAAKSKFVPLRDSKLTRILDGAIGGNCKTVLLACATSAAAHFQETLSCFDFASRAMNVEVRARINASVDAGEMKSLLAELGIDDDAFLAGARGGSKSGRRGLTGKNAMQLKALAQAQALKVAGAQASASEAAERAELAEEQARATHTALASWQERAAAAEAELLRLAQEVAAEAAARQQETAQERQRAEEEAAAAALAEAKVSQTEGAVADWQERAGLAEAALEAARHEQRMHAAIVRRKASKDKHQAEEATVRAEVAEEVAAAAAGKQAEERRRASELSLAAQVEAEALRTQQRRSEERSQEMEHRLAQQAAALAEANAMIQGQRRLAEAKELEFRNELAQERLRCEVRAQEAELQRQIAEAREAGREAREAATEATRLRGEAATAAFEANAAREAAVAAEEGAATQGGRSMVFGAGAASHGEREFRPALRRTVSTFPTADASRRPHFPLPAFLLPRGDTRVPQMIASGVAAIGRAPPDGRDAAPAPGADADASYDPEQAAQYIAWLGVDPDQDALLFGALRAVLSKVLPRGWTMHKDGRGRTYFWNGLTNESHWTHPDHEIFNAIIRLRRLSAEQPDPCDFLQQIAAKLEAFEPVEPDRWSGPYFAEGGDRYWYDAEKDMSMWYDPVAEATRHHALKLDLVRSLWLGRVDVRGSADSAGSDVPREDREGGAPELGPGAAGGALAGSGPCGRSRPVPLAAEEDALSRCVAMSSAPPTACAGGRPGADAAAGPRGGGSWSASGFFSPSASGSAAAASAARAGELRTGAVGERRRPAGALEAAGAAQLAHSRSMPALSTPKPADGSIAPFGQARDFVEMVRVETADLIQQHVCGPL